MSSTPENYADLGLGHRPIDVPEEILVVLFMVVEIKMKNMPIFLIFGALFGILTLKVSCAILWLGRRVDCIC